MITSEITEKISELAKIPVTELSGSTELYDSSVISSLNLLNLMSYIEEKYKIEIRPEELQESNFKDIQTLSQFVTSKQSK